MKTNLAVPMLGLLLCLLPSRLSAADKLQLKDLPPAVQKIVQNNLGSGKLGAFTKTVENGATYFETEVMRGGETYAMSITPNGKWFSIEIELSAATQLVQSHAKKLAAGGEIDNVTKNLEDGDVTFEIEMTLKDRYHSYVIGPKGKVRSHSEEFKLTELPPPVQATIKKQLGIGKLGDLYRVEEDGEVYFSVEATKDGKEIGFSVAPGGKFLGFDE